MEQFLIQLPRKTFAKKRKNQAAAPGSSTSTKTDYYNDQQTTMPSKVPKKEKSVQMFIDLGQKSFGKSKECPSCGMLYVISDFNDLKKHSQFCKTTNCPSLPSLKGHKILSSFNYDQDNIIEVNLHQSLHNSAIKEVLRVVENELGNCTDLYKEPSTSIKVYLFLRGKLVVACLVTEEVPSSQLVVLSSAEDALNAFPRDPNGNQDENQNQHQNRNLTQKRQRGDKMGISGSTGSSNSSNSSSDSSNDRSGSSSRIDSNNADADSSNNNSGDISGVSSKLHSGISVGSGSKINRAKVVSSSNSSSMGVQRIWVHARFRRQSVASLLVDVARKFRAYGEVVQRSKVAFSQPTREGFAFAHKYCTGGKGTVLAYC